MCTKRFFVMSCALIVGLLGAAACMPATGGQPNSAMSATGTPSSQVQSNDGGVLVDTAPKFDAELTAQPAGKSEPSAGSASGVTTSGTPSSQVQSSDNNVVVDVAPKSEAELTAQPPGQSEPGAGAASDVTQTGNSAEGGQTQPGSAESYVNTTYKFRVNYPADFVLQSQSAEKLAQLDPEPVSAFAFMNPLAAASDVAELELADLEIRVYPAGQTATLNNWLAVHGQAPADGSVSQQPFKTANVSGVKTCASTMIIPDCFYFVMGSDWVYQLIPASQQGEAMIDTFVVLP